MRKNLFFFPAIVFLSIMSVNAQVKIGDNLNSINANSLLELESTNKGFLAPRVALNSLNSASPLTAPVTAGMLVYSSGGAVADGYYVWDGSKWNKLITSSIVRDNFVLVKSESDFPAAVNGIITLQTNTVYEINGTVTVANKINLNNSWIQGVHAIDDKLVYTGASGELFTGTAGGNLHKLSFTAATSGTRLFNLDAAGANNNLIIENCYIIGCDNIGMVKSFAGTVYLNTIACLYNNNGISFQNDTNVVLENMLWDKTNRNIYEKFTGTFSIIQKVNGDMLVLSSNTATAFDVSGITGIRAGELKAVLFTGNGTYKNGTFSKNWEVESTGLKTEKDDVASGNLYITTPAITSFSASNTPVKVTCTTTSANLFRVTTSGSNRLIYAGTKTRSFQVICSTTITASSNNKYFSFYIALNGTILPESRQTRKISTGADQGAISLSCIVNLSPGDYIELWVENNTDNTAMTVESMNMAIK